MADYVDGILNGNRLIEVNDVFDANYRDFHPIHLPDALKAPPNGVGGVYQLFEYSDFLARDGVDIQFSIEDAVINDTGIGYRLFGEGRVALVALAGTVQTSENSGPLDPKDYVVREGKIEFRGTADAIETELSDAGVHVTIECVGLFRIKSGRLSDRWGPMQIGA